MYEVFARILEQKKLKPIDVSRETGISLSTLTDWKKGRYTPKVDKRRKIADYLGVTLDYLDTGKDTAKQSKSGKKYYFDDDTAAKAQQLFEQPGLRMLFDAAQDSRPEDLQMAADLLKRLKGTNPDG